MRLSINRGVTTWVYLCPAHSQGTLADVSGLLKIYSNTKEQTRKTHSFISQYQRENLPIAQQQATLTARKQAQFCIACIWLLLRYLTLISDMWKCWQVGSFYLFWKSCIFEGLVSWPDSHSWMLTFSSQLPLRYDPSYFSQDHNHIQFCNWTDFNVREDIFAFRYSRELYVYICPTKG